MIEKITKYIKQYNMLDECERIVVGLSGGADSVCLLHALHSVIEQGAYDIRLMAVHINHGIRGDEAARDEAFAKTFCENLGVDFVSERVNVPELADIKGMSEEEAGREVRYTVFAKYAGMRGKVAVAHHMDDQAETVLMNIFRGSGMRGVSGMVPVRGNIIRPLLCVTRHEIENYIAGQGLSYVTDSTNSENVYTRNRMRNELLPYVKQNFNPEVVKHLAYLSEEIRQCDEVVTEYVKECINRCVTENDDGKEYTIDVELFAVEPYIVQSKAIMELMRKLSLRHKDLYRTHVNSVRTLLDMQVGKCISLPYGMKAVRTYDSIKLTIEDYTLSETKKDFFVEVDAELNESIDVNLQVYDGEKMRILESVCFEVVENDLQQKDFCSEKNVYTKCFDYDKIKGTLVLRFRKEGDVIAVSRDGKKRKLKKELIDRKILKQMRDSIMLLAMQDTILWAVGVRRCEEYLVDESTKRVLVINFCFEEEE